MIIYEKNENLENQKKKQFNTLIIIKIVNY